MATILERLREQEKGRDIIRETREVEAQTREQVEGMLEAAGLKRDSQSFKDYSKAKKLVFRGLFINCAAYDRQIRWIIDYLSV